jgi:hypothetical protein
MFQDTPTFKLHFTIGFFLFMDYLMKRYRDNVAKDGRMTDELGSISKE